MISGGGFDKGWRRAKAATGYEHGEGPTTDLAGLFHSMSVWPRSLVRKLMCPIIAAGR